MNQAPRQERLYRMALIAAAAIGVGVAVGLGLASHRPWVVIAATLLFGVSLLRPQWGALLLLALAVPDLLVTVEVDRFTVRAAQLAATGTTLGLAVDLVRRGELLATLRRIPIALWCFVAFGLLALLRLAVLGAPNPTKGYAYAVWGLFVAVAIAGNLAFVLQRREQIARALTVFVGAIAVLALFGLTQWTIGVLGGKPPLLTQWVGSMPRINGLSFEPSYFAFSTVLGCALALCGLLGERSFLRVGMAAAAVCLTVSALQLASSRSGWIGLVGLLLFAVAVVTLRRARLQRQQWRGLAAVLACLAIGGVLMATVRPAEYVEMANRAINVEEPTSSKPRLEGVGQAVSMFRSAPLLGVGLAQFGGVIMAEQPGTFTPRQIDEIVTFNLYVELLAENGLVGCVLVLAGLLLCARGVWRSWRHGDPQLATMALAVLVAGVAIFGIMYQFNQTLFRTEVWCLLGLALAIDRVRDDPPDAEAA